MWGSHTSIGYRDFPRRLIASECLQYRLRTFLLTLSRIVWAVVWGNRDIIGVHGVHPQYEDDIFEQ